MLRKKLDWWGGLAGADAKYYGMLSLRDACTTPGQLYSDVLTKRMG